MTDEIKKAIAATKTEEEKQAVLGKYKEKLKKLTDEDIEEVVGGKTESMLEMCAAAEKEFAEKVTPKL